MANELSRSNAALESLEILVGEWELEVSSFHAEPSVRISGQASFQWLEGGAFLQLRAHLSDPVFPSQVSVIGPDDAAGNFSMLYFDSRGVSRIYQMSLTESSWNLWRDFPVFSQRFLATFNDDRTVLSGAWENSTDGANWERDFNLKYTKIVKA